MDFTDQMGNLVTLTKKPKRIISLVPSQTELLAHWGLDEDVIGITKFCIHPDNWFKNKTRVGGTKKLNYEVIESLKPDLIIGNLEENERSDIEYLQERYPVWMSDIKNLEDCYDMMQSLGKILEREKEADILVADLKDRFNHLKADLPDACNMKVAYFIWQEPLMVAAGDTFIDEMLKISGFCNVFSAYKRYPEICTGDLQSLAPDAIFLSSEPYPFGEKHIEHFKRLCPNSKVIVVDGELFSWYGSRLLHAPEYFKNLQSFFNA
jgi:ABC-type Fe3+-hydroxamate transport system substrate-binding protein